ncbi:hypothetical protein [Xanthomonas arboricola]|uniref:hypothetical protein n=1 Tax=Xanthomonas arboricola TaxID=56448 RepID=UPI00142F409C|nr:hypothetical protein [Xanthomonas arboricola]NJB80343.1 hypothetical protein [Xanthomonas arboricola]
MNEQSGNSGQLPQAEAGSGGDAAKITIAQCPAGMSADYAYGWNDCINTLAARQPVGVEPVPMVLHCPRCHLQHIDAPDERTAEWDNPPHRSQLCHGCGCIWRPADVPTVGVERTQTTGKNDSPPAPAAVPVDGLRDAERIDAIAREYWRLDPIEIPTGAGDADVGWRVSQFVMPNRIQFVAEVFVDDPRQAIDAAMRATHPQPAAAVPSTGVQAIAEERARQVQVEGMTPEGDAGYRYGQLAWAAVAYMQLSAMELRDGGRAHIATASPPACWPWDASWWKPRDVRRDLVRAGALIAAQLDAIDQQAKPEVRNG